MSKQYRANSPLLEVRVRESFKQIYKEKVNGDDINKMASMFEALESMGVEVTRATGEMIKRQEEEKNMFVD